MIMLAPTLTRRTRPVPDIELSTYIEGLREELQRAVDAGKEKDLRFFNDKIELEVEVAVETTLAAEGKTSFRVLLFDASFKGGANRKLSNKHKLKLTLIPAHKSDKEGVWVSGSGAKLGF
jgi:hypothetical protein